jgi:uncharacterized protein YggU (UPF0235/DUF167 family)
MKIFVKVKPRAKNDSLIRIDENIFLASVKAIPEKGKANEAVINLLAQYFKISKNNIKIISGLSSKNKIIEVLN